MIRFDEHTHASPRRAPRLWGVAAMIGLAGTMLAGCGDDDDASSGQATTDETQPTTETGGTESNATDEDGATAQVTVDIVDIEQAFEPSTVTVTAGGEVTWVNSDDIPHTTTATDGTWDSGNLDAGAEFTFTADEPGTYPYICDIHPTMKGEVVVE